MCGISIKYKRIAYFSKEALKAISTGDEELKEFYVEVITRQVTHADVCLFFDFDFIDT